MLIRKFADDYYLCHPKKGSAKHKPNRNLKKIWFVKYTANHCGTFTIGQNQITVPRELIGKKIMFKVEIDELMSVEV